MYCNACGLKNPADACFCSRCGKAVSQHAFHDTQPSDISALTNHSLSATAAGTTAPTEQESKATKGGLVGVRGWLLFLCWSLCVVGPIVSIGGFYQAWHDVVPNWSSIPGARDAFFILLVHTVVGTSFSVYAGFLLWTVKPGAVGIAKGFLVFTLLADFVAMFLVLGLAKLPDEISSTFGKDAAKSVIKGIIYFAVWFAYLHKSERVRSTYGTSTIRDWSNDTMIGASEVAGMVVLAVFAGAVVYSNLPY